MMMRVKVERGEDGDLFVPLPLPLLNALQLKEGDVMAVLYEHEGWFTFRKVEKQNDQQQT